MNGIMEYTTEEYRLAKFLRVLAIIFALAAIEERSGMREMSKGNLIFLEWFVVVYEV